MYISRLVKTVSQFFDRRNFKRNLAGLLVLLIWLLTMHSSIVHSEPMLAPTFEEAINSKTIVIAEYIGFENQPEIRYFGTNLKAYYRVTEIIKGQPIEEYVELRYAFQDGSACLPPGDWKFSSKMMPKKGSLWILFLNDKNSSGSYETYRGDYGRWQADEKNISEVKSAVISKYGSLSEAKPIIVKRPVIINYYLINRIIKIAIGLMISGIIAIIIVLRRNNKVL